MCSQGTSCRRMAALSAGAGGERARGAGRGGADTARASALRSGQPGGAAPPGGAARDTAHDAPHAAAALAMRTRAAAVAGAERVDRCAARELVACAIGADEAASAESCSTTSPGRPWSARRGGHVSWLPPRALGGVAGGMSLVDPDRFVEAGGEAVAREPERRAPRTRRRQQALAVRVEVAVREQHRRRICEKHPFNDKQSQIRRGVRPAGPPQRGGGRWGDRRAPLPPCCGAGASRTRARARAPRATARTPRRARSPTAHSPAAPTAPRPPPAPRPRTAPPPARPRASHRAPAPAPAGGAWAARGAGRGG
jgi:hypothetical protein